MYTLSLKEGGSVRMKRNLILAFVSVAFALGASQSFAATSDDDSNPIGVTSNDDTATLMVKISIQYAMEYPQEIMNAFEQGDRKTACDKASTLSGIHERFELPGSGAIARNLAPRVYRMIIASDQEIAILKSVCRNEGKFTVARAYQAARSMIEKMEQN
jgi:hypothetical protein